MGKADTLASRVLELLDDPRPELRCAAALVLGNAGKGNADVARALAGKLHDADAAMLRFVLDGFEALGARGHARDLAPLLGRDDEEVRAHAARLLEKQGAGAEAAVERQLADGPPVARRAAAALLVKMGTTDAIDALLAQLGDHETGEVILQRVRAQIDAGDEKAHKVWGTRAAAAVKKAKKDEGLLAGLLRLLGYFADPANLKLLFAHAGAGKPHAIRLAAIAAMRRILAKPGKTDEAVAALIEWADDADPAVARSAIDTLRGARIPEALARKLGTLAKAKNPDARRLAMERMAAVGSSAIAALIANLSGTDPGARDAALRALQSAPDAAAALAQALAESETQEHARRFAQALRGHEGRIPTAALAAIGRAAAARLDQHGDPVGTILNETHARLAPEAHAEVLFAHAGRLAKDGHPGEAFAALRPLAYMNVKMTDEQRLFLGVLGLKVGGKDLLRAARSVDPVLGQFAQLVGAGYPVAKNLLKRKDLDADELFTLGFNFVESHDEEEKDFGRELLQAIVERQPRGKLAVAAKNKLRLAGED